MRFFRPLMGSAFATTTALAVLAAACAGDNGGSDDAPADRLIIYEGTAAEMGTNIYTIDAKTGESVQITTGRGFTGNPGWSPDYTKVVFVSDREREQRLNDVWVMAADGSDPRRLTDTPDLTEWSPKFSPDGETIAFVQSSEEGNYVMVMNADGTDAHRVAGPYRFAEFPAWRRDGREVWFSAIPQEGRNDADLFSVDPETEEVRTRISTSYADVCPHFTRDGKTVTYASVAAQSSLSTNIDLFAHDLSSDDTTGVNDIRLTDNPEVDDYGNPSPDDKTFVFLSRRDGQSELYLMDADGENERRLTTTPDLRENVPDW